VRERVLVVTYGVLQLRELARLLMEGLQGDAEMRPTQWNDPTIELSGRSLGLSGGFVTIATVDTVMRGEEMTTDLFSLLVVLDGQRIFSHPPDATLEGQHVWVQLSRRLSPGTARTVVLHDRRQVGNHVRIVYPDGACETRCDGLHPVARLTGSIQRASLPFCRPTEATCVHPEALMGLPVECVDVLPTAMAELRGGCYAGYLLELEGEGEGEGEELAREELGWIAHYANAISTWLMQKWNDSLALDGCCLQAGMLGVVVPGACGRAWWRKLKEHTAAHLAPQSPILAEMMECSSDTWVVGLERRMWWGPVESVAGLERDIVLATGFHAPRAQMALARGGADALVYTAVTYCRLALCVAEPSAREWLRVGAANTV